MTKIAELPETSIVPFPAYSATNVEVALRSIEKSKSTGEPKPTLGEPDDPGQSLRSLPDTGDIRTDFKQLLKED